MFFKNHAYELSIYKETKMTKHSLAFDHYFLVLNQIEKNFQKRPSPLLREKHLRFQTPAHS